MCHDFQNLLRNIIYTHIILLRKRYKFKNYDPIVNFLIL